MLCANTWELGIGRLGIGQLGIGQLGIRRPGTGVLRFFFQKTDENGAHKERCAPYLFTQNDSPKNSYLIPDKFPTIHHSLFTNSLCKHIPAQHR